MVFNDDGTYTSNYYWVGGGQWSHVDGEFDKIEIQHSLLGQEYHRVAINGDELELIQQNKDNDGKWNDTQMVYRFKRKGSASDEKITEEIAEPVTEENASESEIESVTEVTSEEKSTDENEEVSLGTEEIEEKDDSIEKEHSYGYIDVKELPENEEIIKELKELLELNPDPVEGKPDILVDYIIDDFDDDGELEGVACTTPAYNGDSIEEGWYDALYPATLWGYDKGDDGKNYWLSDLFYDKADGYVSMKEAYIRPGIKVLEVDYFQSAHSVKSQYYVIDGDNSRLIGSFDDGYVTDRGVIATDHDGYLYDPETDRFETTDIY